MNFVYFITKSNITKNTDMYGEWVIDDIIDCFSVGNKLSLLEFKKFTKDKASFDNDIIINLNNSDIESLRNNGLTVVYFYPNSKHYIADIDHDFCKEIKRFLRDKKINSIVNE
jgi:hypothetical protein